MPDSLFQIEVINFYALDEKKRRKRAKYFIHAFMYNDKFYRQVFLGQTPEKTKQEEAPKHILRKKKSHNTL